MKFINNRKIITAQMVVGGDYTPAFRQFHVTPNRVKIVVNTEGPLIIGLHVQHVFKCGSADPVMILSN